MAEFSEDNYFDLFHQINTNVYRKNPCQALKYTHF
jgi:hypothetical protein